MMQIYKYYLSHPNNNRDIAQNETINYVPKRHFRRNSVFFEDFFRYADRLHSAYLTLQCQKEGSMGVRSLSASRFARQRNQPSAKGQSLSKGSESSNCKSAKTAEINSI